ncbi:MAG: hypothetical protein ACE5R4_07205 [Armatimonadota bacterium]
MRCGAYLLSASLGLIGLIFLVGNQGLTHRLLVGTVLLVMALAVGALAMLRPSQPAAPPIPTPPVTPDLAADRPKCRNCRASLPQDAIELREGAIFVNCPSCGTFYRSEEAP